MGWVPIEGELPAEGHSRLLFIRENPHPWRSIVVARWGGQWLAYWNVCRHVPIPLDAGVGHLEPGDHWVCATHGARFRVADGRCVEGPCEGASLFPVPLEERRGQLLVDATPPQG